jgi:hypothetical protein
VGNPVRFWIHDYMYDNEIAFKNYLDAWGITGLIWEVFRERNWTLFEVINL